MLEYFPAELRALPQWMCAGSGDPAGEHYKAPISPKTKNWGSVTKPEHWGTLDECLALGYPLVGFVFNENDPYAVIDLDTYKAQAEATREMHAEILRHAGTYCETSQSGFGTHIIGRGSLTQGARNDANAIELYSHARFMICTGNPTDGVVQPLADIQPMLDYLFGLMKRSPHGIISWRDLDAGEEGELDDLDLIEKIESAENGDKFLALCQGDMSAYGNDHSAADMAFIQFLCFYTPDNDQVRRIFKASPLGDREKADRPDYVPRTIARARQMIANDAPPPVDMSAVLERARSIAPVPAAPDPTPPLSDAPEAPPTVVSDVSFPPGLVGEIAAYILASAPYPVPAAALAGAIALMAGIVGRNFNVSNPGTGLNQYILYLAKSGTGKEAIQGGISRIFSEIIKEAPAAERFLGPSNFASGQALAKQFVEKPCFVAVLGEFSFLIRQMLSPRGGEHEKAKVKVMLDLYNKSGWNDYARGHVHSNKDNNVGSARAPALTLIGETVPETFFAGLDEAALENGFIPRWLTIEYTGDRPEFNETPMTEVPPALVRRMIDLTAQVLEMEQKGHCVIVMADSDASAMLRKFRIRCDQQIRGSDQTLRHLWNRAHVKALRLAALVAVGVNSYQPIVTTDHVRWAIDLVERDVAVMLDRFARGDVGEGDSKQHADIVRIIERHLSQTSKTDTSFAARGCVSARHLQQATAARAAFKNDRRGANRALKDLLDTMVASGELTVLPKKQAQEWFKTTGSVYALGDQWNV